MGFKSMNQYVEEKNKDFFVLPDDGSRAEVIFLYHSINDPVIATAHYISAGKSSGYYFCCEEGCPACAPGPGRDKGIWKQDKLFIPLYNITTGKIEIWDRSARFRDQLIRDVFNPFPDPSGYVFTIVRHGEARSVDTTYQITVTNLNSSVTIEQILASAHKTMDDIYAMAIKEITPFEMKLLLDENSGVAANNTAAAYGAVPRPGSTTTGFQQITPPEIIIEPPTIDLPTNFGAPTDISEIAPPPVVDVPEPVDIPESPTENNEEVPTLGDLGDVKF